TDCWYRQGDIPPRRPPVNAKRPRAPGAGGEPRPALALDLTRTHARAFLLERVDGQARLVATGEALAAALGPMADVATAARTAIAPIEATVGRTLFAHGGVLRPRG